MQKFRTNWTLHILFLFSFLFSCFLCCTNCVDAVCHIWCVIYPIRWKLVRDFPLDASLHIVDLFVGFALLNGRVTFYTISNAQLNCDPQKKNAGEFPRHFLCVSEFQHRLCSCHTMSHSIRSHMRASTLHYFHSEATSLSDSINNVWQPGLYCCGISHSCLSFAFPIIFNFVSWVSCGFSLAADCSALTKGKLFRASCWKKYNLHSIRNRILDHTHTHIDTSIVCYYRHIIYVWALVRFGPDTIAVISLRFMSIYTGVSPYVRTYVQWTDL